VHARDGDPLAGPLRRALESGGVGDGVLVCLPPGCAEEDLAPALAGVQAAATRPDGRFVLVQHGRGASGLAKTLRLEAPGVRTTIVDVAAGPGAVERVVAEVAATDGFAEVVYDEEGMRRVPTLRVVPLRPPRTTPLALGAGDVLLVTGGGKGITAECALALALDTGASLAILGRSDPGTDAELGGNLARMAGAGVTVRYVRADVTDPDRVRAAVGEVAAELGPVTGLLHGAGHNAPAALTALDPAAIRAAFAPKLDGLDTVLAAVDPAALRLLVTFGSVIGRAGLRGEGHYATANDWLAARTAELAARFPACRALCLEWSVWSGTGMGERLSVVESLGRDGVTAITPDQGVAVLRRLLADPATPPAVVVSGRTGGIETLRYEQPELALLRFLEQPLVHYGGVELITQVELSAGTDPYLDDHELDGNLLFPAVLGLEAMAQVGSAVVGVGGAPVFSGVEFRRPIVVPRGGSTPIRIAATVTGDAEVRW
jgi:enediyne polyketide synthase